ncbi:sensor histidine kinase [Paenibacillus flagellatus]|uniref:Heme sensor protein HssS n=1 Tax=Paenibacillus flagellatus TaxID=2211139 RepID=A0A2V5KUC9_9BACL|nr:HAMP domain-containing sensor histidine kinase [Paenibacillus flagellatus]PYI55487.1 two-component sensor histidine kinase [Paenibacillus flagellatus]
MIRTLYMRIAIVIFFVVWCSLALSSFTFSHYFRSQLNGRVEELLQNAAKLVVRLIQETEPQQLGQTVTIAARLNRGQELQLFAEGGERFSSGPGQKTMCVIPDDTVRDVLEGSSYSSFQSGESEQCPQGSVGTPFEYGGKRYALFVSPIGPRPVGRFDFIDFRNLLTIFLISTFLIALAAVYLVRPLKQITEATRKIAGGDFNVKLRIRQRDELGSLASSITHMAEELNKMEKMRQEFVSNVSHDIQTPLTSIRGFSKLLQRDTLAPDERLGYLRLIESESERLSRLSENLLKLASLDSEHHPHHPKSIQLDEQLRRSVVACEPLWSAKRLDIELELPPVRIVADEDSLNQVWTNLLHNAIKFTPPEGRIVVSLSEDERRATVTVSDTGIGIAYDDQPHLFRRFYKADASRQSSDMSGSGLGLAIVKKIVDLHEGAIELTSEPGAGTTIRVSLPKAGA